MANWFERLFGFSETSPQVVKENIELRDRSLHSLRNEKSYSIGQLTTPSLQELRTTARKVIESNSGKIHVQNVLGDIRDFHCDPANSNGLFQVASQFNLLEMVNPYVTPEQGVTGYESDLTQGPICAISAGAATVYRNYFVNVREESGQTSNNQIDCLSDVGKTLGNNDNDLWSMTNGYALCSPEGLSKINDKLNSSTEEEKDIIRQNLRIGVHSGVEVTDTNAPSGQLVSQVFCSALPIAYFNSPQSDWSAFASLILEGAYEATLCAAIINSSKTGSDKLFLTQLGGGAFGNDSRIIYSAMRRAFLIYKNTNLNIQIVSYGEIDSELEKMVQSFTQ